MAGNCMGAAWARHVMCEFAFIGTWIWKEQIALKRRHIRVALHSIISCGLSLHDHCWDNVRPREWLRFCIDIFALFVTLNVRLKIRAWFVLVGQDSSVGIAIRYGLDAPGIESRWGRVFPHPFRPALGTAQPHVKWVPGLFPGGKTAGAWRWLLIPFSAEGK